MGQPRFGLDGSRRHRPAHALRIGQEARGVRVGGLARDVLGCTIGFQALAKLHQEMAELVKQPACQAEGPVAAVALCGPQQAPALGLAHQVLPALVFDAFA